MCLMCLPPIFYIICSQCLPLFLQKGNYIQIHNPGKQNVVFVEPDKIIDLESDIINVAGKE